MVIQTMPSEHAAGVQDSVDCLLPGRSLAAGHQLLRLADQRAAATFRVDAYAECVRENDFPTPAEPTPSRVCARRAFAKFLG
jgi:hypothetical protein